MTLTTEVHGARELHALTMADRRRKSRSKPLEEVQGSATSSLFTPLLFQNMWPCVQLAMLHASETWPLTKPTLQCLQRNDRAMIKQIDNVRPQDIVTTRSNDLHVQLGIEDLDFILKDRRLQWYGHVERSNDAVKTAFDIQVDGKRGPWRPKMTEAADREGLQRVEALSYQPS